MCYKNVPMQRRWEEKENNAIRRKTSEIEKTQLKQSITIYKAMSLCYVPNMQLKCY